MEHTETNKPKKKRNKHIYTHLCAQISIQNTKWNAQWAKAFAFHSLFSLLLLVLFRHYYGGWLFFFFPRCSIFFFVYMYCFRFLFSALFLCRQSRGPYHHLFCVIRSVILLFSVTVRYNNISVFAAKLLLSVEANDSVAQIEIFSFIQWHRCSQSPNKNEVH